MTDDELTAIEQRAEAATPGPWAWAQTAEKGYGANVGARCFADGDEKCERPLSGDLSELEDDYYVDQSVCEMGNQDAAPNAAFIASCRTDVPALCREVRRLTAENDELRARPTLEQVVGALDDTYWEESCDVRRAIERTIQVLYAAETPHD